MPKTTVEHAYGLGGVSRQPIAVCPNVIPEALALQERTLHVELLLHLFIDEAFGLDLHHVQRW